MKKGLLFTVIVFFIVVIFTFSTRRSIAADNLVGYWKFDQGSGTSPIDSSGENVSGSFTSTQPTWSTDVPSTSFTNPYSLDFTRTGDAVTVAWPSSLNFGATAPRSFSFWYKPTGNGETASGNFDRIISWQDDKFEIAGTYGDVSVHRLAFYDGSWRDTGFNMSVGTWYNITFTYDGTNIKLYVNNVERFSGTSGGRALSGTMYIGGRYTGDEGINGRIDDVRVYDRALTAQEVQDISEGGSGPGVPTSTPTPSPTPTATPTPTITNTPTPSPTSEPAASSSSSSSCGNQKPPIPDLFQVSTSPNTVTIYFKPVTPNSGYFMSYGANTDASEHSESFEHPDASGAISYTVNGLSENKIYYFKVQAKNGCKAGDWSAIKSATTTGGESFESGNQPQGTIEVVKKEQTAKPKPTPAKTKSSPQTDGYDITIKVEKDGKPVANATVEIHSVPRRTVTDKEGIARFTNVEKGDHKVFLSYKDYKGEEKITVDGLKKDVSINMKVELKPNATYFSTAAIIVIILLLIVIAFFVFLFWKNRRSL